MPLYALTLFSSSLLLFVLQFVTARQILPWFGGAAAVWITCLVFYQGALLLGYAYADWSARRLAPRRQAIVHAALLAASLFLLPLAPDASWKPEGAENPAGRILALLAATIGLPYFLLATTNPLLQAWFARGFPAANPYRLFALSNLASMIAVLGYPLAVEPWLGIGAQVRIWSFAYAAFAALCGAAAWRSLRPASGPAAAPPEAPAAPPATRTWLLWAALAATASFLLLAVTNHLTQNVAAVPLLWALPLSLYLLSFILCFDARGWYRRDLFLGLLAAALCALAWTPAEGSLAARPAFQIGLASMALFVAGMFCHGELYELRPAPRDLTRYYLMIALGGAAGALLAGTVAPLALGGIWELDIGLAALAALAFHRVRGRGLAIRGIAAAVILATLLGSLQRINAFMDRSVLTARNFYGVLRVREDRDPANPANDRRELLHGTITHGDQMLDPRAHRAVGTYYQTTSGIGRALFVLQRPGLRVGVIGLGVGTLAAYGRPGDLYRFYEINPAVVQAARRDFSYLRNSAAKIDIVLGDARLHLEREPDRQFDLIAVDAFSGDAIPLHLLTREALGVYLRHLRPGGVIAFHVSNQYFELASVVRRLADAHGLGAVRVFDKQTERNGFASHWVLLTADRGFFEAAEIKSAATAIAPQPQRRAWTDDFSNLLQALK